MKTIFLIDDQPITNYITKKLFEVNGVDNPVIDFTNPELAFEALNAKQQILILLDLNMPEMTGWEFLDKMKKEQNIHETVILTSSSSKLDREKAKEYPNVLAYVEKPLDKIKFKELFQQLRLL